MTVTCDLFTLAVSISPRDRQLRFSLRTDLPCGTIVILDCRRHYEDFDHERCVWTMFSEKLVVDRTSDGDLNGVDGVLDVDEGDRKALRRFGETTDGFSAGILGPIEEAIEVSAMVGARQRLRIFGANNQALEGASVTRRGPVKVVEAIAEAAIPMAPDFQPISE